MSINIPLKFLNKIFLYDSVFKKYLYKKPVNSNFKINLFIRNLYKKHYGSGYAIHIYLYTFRICNKMYILKFKLFFELIMIQFKNDIYKVWALSSASA